PVIYANPAISRMTGYDAAEFLGKNPRFLQGEQTDQPGLEEIRNAIASKRPVEVIVRNFRKDGSSFYNEVHIAPVRSESGDLTHFIGVETDVTREVEMDQQLRQSQKMEAIGQLTGGVAHDFNNLLTVIMGNLEMLEALIGDDARLGAYIKDASEAAQMGARLTDQLLAFGRKQALSPSGISVNAMVAGMADLLRRTLGETISIETRLTELPTAVWVDAAQLQNALLNMVINSRDAMPQGGTLVIETARVTVEFAVADEEREITAPGDYVVLRVTDTGVGIAPENLERVFDPFFTTKSAGFGTGLGLSMVYGFAKQSGGQVRISSTPGAGATISILLPYRPDGLAADEGVADPQTAIPRGAGEVILI
ncbi:MAG: PAS domain-containing protein, partial [Alphaproteobacteria bacterium]